LLPHSIVSWLSHLRPLRAACGWLGLGAHLGIRDSPFPELREVAHGLVGSALIRVDPLLAYSLSEGAIHVVDRARERYPEGAERLLSCAIPQSFVELPAGLLRACPRALLFVPPPCFRFEASLFRMAAALITRSTQIFWGWRVSIETATSFVGVRRLSLSEELEQIDPRWFVARDLDVKARAGDGVRLVA
jgi:hypothetical protein